MRAVCLLAARPPPEYLAFAATLAGHGYDIIVCTDQDACVNPAPSGVEILAYDGAVVKSRGYWGTVMYFPNRACARDKALYHFCEEPRAAHYETVWFLEQDVYFASIDTLAALDARHGADIDLLCKTIVMEGCDPLGRWLWDRAHNHIHAPRARSQICAIRASRCLLDAIRRHAAARKRLFFDEVMFPTLAIHAGLRLAHPSELETIDFRRPWPDEALEPHRLYHPIKCVHRQARLRMRDGRRAGSASMESPLPSDHPDSPRT